MRLTREKIVRLSHKMMDVLVASNEVEFVEDRDTIRQSIVTILTNQLREEEKWDGEARKKISSMKKEILEDSEEWSVLYRKFYTEGLRRNGIAEAPEYNRLNDVLHITVLFTRTRAIYEHSDTDKHH